MSKQSNIDYSAVKSLPDLLNILREKEVPSNLIWKYVDIYQEQKARKAGIPLFGQFELTPLCNLDCKMCYVSTPSFFSSCDSLCVMFIWMLST